jgi:hypothetical protein
MPEMGRKPGSVIKDCAKGPAYIQRGLAVPISMVRVELGTWGVLEHHRLAAMLYLATITKGIAYVERLGTVKTLENLCPSILC